MTYNPNDEWDRYMTRYGGYAPATLENFVERGLATYDEATDTYTVRCDCRDNPGKYLYHDSATCSPFTVGLSPEFAEQS